MGGGILYTLLLVPRALERVRLGLSDWAFDIAFFHNLIFHASRGEGFVQTASTHELDGLLQLSHAFFLLPAYVPFYWLRPGLDTLVTLQVLALALGVLPVLALAKRRGIHSWGLVLLAICYWSAPPLLRLSVADFNPLLLGIPLLLVVAWALEAASRPVLLGLVLLTCAVREELPMLVASLALGQGLLGRVGWRRVGEVVGVCLLFFAVGLGVRPRASFYIPFTKPWELLSLAEQVPDSGVPWSRKLSFLSTYLPAGLGAAVFSPLSGLAALPLLAYQLGVSGYEWWHWKGPYVHHLALLLPLVVLGTVEGVARLGQRFERSPWLSRWGREGVLLVGLLLQLPDSWLALEEPLGQRDSADERLTRAERAEAVAKLIAQVPAEAPVASDYVWMALLSGRPVQYAYQSAFLERSQPQESGRITPGLDRVTYFLLDDEHTEWRQRLEADTRWSLVGEAAGHRLFKRESPLISQP